MDTTPVVGLYGKLPSHGDFLRRRVADGFVTGWDTWLQECMTTSRSMLGDQWLDVYLTSPAWRFACAANACGPRSVMGVMVPSVDSVGRYFPLTLVVEVPDTMTAVSAVSEAEPFFAEAERLVIDTLATERIDFDQFDLSVQALGDVLAQMLETPAVVLERAAAAILDGDHQTAWRIPTSSAEDAGSAMQQVLASRLLQLYEPAVLWWTDGSNMVDPTLLLGSGLPPPRKFATLLDGAGAPDDWTPVRAQRTPRAPSPALVPQTTETDMLVYQSAAASDVGRVRPINQDAFVECPDLGVWVVADGLGGHRNGEVASRMVCDGLADQMPRGTLDEMVESSKERLLAVNRQLRESHASAVDGVTGGIPGSTVVALVTRGHQYAVLWAGDSRVYRWRAGRLEQVTRDHSAVGDGAGEQVSSIVTRAVGGQSDLLVDAHYDQVLAGDRFLLCSDGLTRVVPEAEIQTWVGTESIRAATDGLIAAALQAGGPDNVTALIVEAGSQRGHHAS